MSKSANQPHLVAAAEQYGVAATELEPLGAFESEVYAFDHATGPAILKVIAPEHRTVDQVQAEVDWLLALREVGVPVSRPLRAASGMWVSQLPAGGQVLVAFERAPGALSGPADWTDDVVGEWGALLGRLQAHSRAWTPPGPRRHALSDPKYDEQIEAFGARDPGFAAAAKLLLESIRPLHLDPHGTDVGLIHADLHHGNLLLEGGRFTAIDFDDSAYGAYAFDLAMPLYYAVRSQREESPGAVAERFLAPFMRGFLSKTQLPVGGPEAIDLSLRWRMAELVIALNAKLPEEKWTDGLRSVERDLRERVSGEVEVVPFDVLQHYFSG